MSLCSFSYGFPSSLKVYDITGKVSSQLYKGYDGLRNNDRVEWNNRYVGNIYQMFLLFFPIFVITDSNIFTNDFYFLFFLNEGVSQHFIH